MEKVRYMISDAASLVNVESHVLRYWEEELDLNIPMQWVPSPRLSLRISFLPHPNEFPS